MSKFILPKKENSFQTEHGDPVFRHYDLLTGWMYKKRLTNTLSLLDDNCEKLLDVGYGSGILFPSLLNFAKICYGLEIHGKEKEIYEMLEKEGADKSRVILQAGSILAMPYENEAFDSIVCVSTLEHMDPSGSLDKALEEIARVLKNSGCAVLSFPVRNVITDFFYQAVGFKPRDIHPSSHNDIIKAAEKYFTIEKILKFPNFKNINLSLYCSIKCLKK
jgi:SAM-dependent methyltransferase